MQLEDKIPKGPLLKAFEHLQKKDLPRAQAELDKALEAARLAQDPVLEALAHSGFGVFYKLKKEFRKAWKSYEQAERLVPDDAALKIISSRLLLDYFGQYDTVISKMKKVQAIAGVPPGFSHQALCLEGLAWLKKSDKKKAAECLKQAGESDFQALESPANIDLRLAFELTKKKIEPELCRGYLTKAIAFAKDKRDGAHEKLFQKVLEEISVAPQ